MSLRSDIFDKTHLEFTRQEWLNFRHDAPMTLTEADLARLQGQIQTISLTEVSEIYLPLSRLLSFYVTSTQALHQEVEHFLSKSEPRVPYLIGVSGSVAVGKSVTSRILQALLSRWPGHPYVQVVTTDCFLYPNAILEARGLMGRKGFPESYDVATLLNFLMAVKSGKTAVDAPLYSHQTYDILPNEHLVVKKPDILILEGVNILQTGATNASPFVSDFLDFSVFVDADSHDIRQWYIDRVVKFSQTSFQDKKAYFHFLSTFSKSRVRAFAEKMWCEINAVNLTENILPTKNRAQLILRKDKKHAIEMVYLRKL
ncbi:MAG: type I pantothenate kinase [Gammaproteobacteria bacterium RIFCSPHIGHO2_12_FULL_42_13]|nr:MAG: type I pantothenate kinase [Gammaproteobacteria bacterium RIFCSPHIGHO2_12_FULL_42_13]